jgi:hypothetical protein
MQCGCGGETIWFQANLVDHRKCRACGRVLMSESADGVRSSPDSHADTKTESGFQQYDILSEL